MTKKILGFIINSCILTLIFCILTFDKIEIISQIGKLIILVVLNIVYILSVIFKWIGCFKISRSLYVSFIISSFCVFGYILLYKLGVLDTISSVGSLKKFILSTREKGVWIYILIQLAQVVILPVPAAIICVVGSLIYGPLLGGIYCSIGVLLGSFISFFIGKTFGYRIVSWIVGKDNTDKYSQIIRTRGGFFLVIAFLLPMFPDDILCLIAGITKMKIKTFAMITILTRPIGVLCMSYFGGGHIIPFTGWGIYVWCIITVIAIAMMFVTYKYQDNMQKFVLEKIFKRNKNKNFKV